MVYGFWNNKGGTGKTSLCFQATCFYAHEHPEERVLVLDVCPQANLSELLLGGMTNQGSARLLARQGELPRATIGGYFQERFPSPYSPRSITHGAFITKPSRFNRLIPDNVDLVCGDPLLELQANAMSTLANTDLPVGSAWLGVIDWIRDFLAGITGDYDIVFIDANPSFSIYTQVALAAVDLLVLPVMADDSSRRAIQNAFSLVYGIKLPSDIYTRYAFATRLEKDGRQLPQVHSVVKNRLTQYMGPATAYDAVLRSMQQDVENLLKAQPQRFSFSKITDGIVNIRDFQTTGVVAFARGCPFYEMSGGRLDVMGHRIQVNQPQIRECVKAMQGLVSKL